MKTGLVRVLSLLGMSIGGISMPELADIAKPMKKSPRIRGNKYVPHQGKREIARRLRQMSGVKLESKPRRMWVCIFDLGEQISTYFSSRRSTIARVRHPRLIPLKLNSTVVAFRKRGAA